MWKYGKVVDNPDSLDKVIEESLKKNDHYQKQVNHQNKFIYKSEKSASDICADYIYEKLEFGNE